jgi:peptidyl-prolyl cis-trans isomerase A (cyclophilin A)
VDGNKINQANEHPFELMVRFGSTGKPIQKMTVFVSASDLTCRQLKIITKKVDFMSAFSRFSRNFIGSSFVFVSSFFVAAQSHSTTVQFQTVMGNIEVNLFDKTTPETVKNFLTYVRDNDYTNTVIHRSVKDLAIIQGGGLTYNNSLPLTSIKSNRSVVNEPVYSNVRGTIAMAKKSRQPNSATNEWFFNLADNSANFDPNFDNSQGYTVFGQVTEASLPVLDAILAVNTFILGSNYTHFPLRNYTTDDYRNDRPVDGTNLVLITNIVVLNASPDTADGLNPPKNTLLKLDSTTDDSGGGSLGLIELLLLLILMYSARNRFLPGGRK